MRQRILIFPFFQCSSKPLINDIPVSGRQYSTRHKPSDLLHEEGDITFCPTLVTLNDGNISVHVTNFTDHPYRLRKGLHIAISSGMTPEQMKYVKPVDPASTWYLLQNDQEQTAHHVRSLIKTKKSP